MIGLLNLLITSTTPDEEEKDVVLNSFLKQATEITLYVEVTQSTTDYYIDDVALEWTDPNHWKQDVDAKIDALRYSIGVK